MTTTTKLVEIAEKLEAQAEGIMRQLVPQTLGDEPMHDRHHIMRGKIEGLQAAARLLRSQAKG